MGSFLIFLTLGLGSSWSFAEYTYQELMIKDYKEMRSIINKYSRSSRNGDEEKSSAELKAELKKGLTILLMRPDRDNISSFLINSLKEEILKYHTFKEALNEVVQDSLALLKDKTNSVEKRTSHLFVIQNALTFAKTLESDAVLKVIYKAKIKIPKDVTSELRLNAEMGEQASPSTLALRILKKRLKERKLEKKRKRKEKRKNKKKVKKVIKKLKQRMDDEDDF